MPPTPSPSGGSKSPHEAPPSTASPRPAKKARTVHTCSRCQRLKIGCDRNRPCSACVRSDAAAECQYRVPPTEAAAASRSPPRGARSGKRQRAVLVCTRCKRLKLRCDQERPCRSCIRGKCEDRCHYVRWPEEDAGAEGRPGAAAASAPAGDELDATLYPPTHRARTASPRASPPATETRRSTPFFQATPTGPVALTPADESIDSLASRFPPVDAWRSHLQSFLNFDLMFRFVHHDEFTRRAEEVMSRWPRVGGEDAALLAMIGAAIWIGGQTEPERGSPGAVANFDRGVIDSLLGYCESHNMIGIDYVHAHLLASMTHMIGEASTPRPAWLSAGRCHHAALMAEIYKDTPGESLLEQETRRRLWWSIQLNKKLLASRLDIEVYPDHPYVPRPRLLSDRALVDPDAPGVESEMPEWAYVDAVLSFADIMLQRRAIMAAPNTPLLDRLAAAHKLCNDFSDSMPAYLRVTAPGAVPHWVYAQAVVFAVAREDYVVQLYRPYFGSSELGSFALNQAADAALRMVGHVQALTSFLLFTWIDSGQSALWAFGTHAFTAGMVLAYALLASPAPDNAPELTSALDAAIGALRFASQSPGSSRSNTRALDILEQLRATVLGRADGDVQPRDPYTGHRIDMPSMGVDLGDWADWEVLFKDLFQHGVL